LFGIELKFFASSQEILEALDRRESMTKETVHI
jgi:hypothetical protein